MQFAPIADFEIPLDADNTVLPELCVAIKESGVLAPLVCERNKESGKLHIKVGVPRYCAAKAAGLIELPYELI